MDAQRVGRAVFGSIGVGLLVGAAFAGWLAWERRVELASHAGWPPVDGVVASVVDARDAQGDPFYWTVVTWSGPDGVEHRSESASGARATVGEVVPLRYDPADPSVAERRDARETWFPAAIFGVMGAGFAGIAARSAIGASTGG